MRSNQCDLGVAACVIHEGRILLVQEAKGPHKGLWGVPKGFVENGETPSSATIRELKEECGIDGRIDSVIGLRECVRNGQTAVFIAYLVKSISTDISFDNDEIMDIGWFSFEDLQSIDWLSPTMHSIASTSFTSSKQMTIHDISSQRGAPYVVYLGSNQNRILMEALR